MRVGRFAVGLAGWAALGGLLVPPGYALWVSFAPGESLTPPTGQWSLRWYAAFARSPQWTAALGNSLVVAAGSAALAVLLGTPLAVAAGGFRPRGRGLVAAGVVVPLAVPPVVLGMGLLPLAQATGLWGTRAALVLAHAVTGLPVVFLLVRARLGALDPALGPAARGLGAGRWRAFRRVTLPLLGPAAAAGGAVGFVLSLNETLAAVFLAAPGSDTLPRLIWPQLRYAVSPAVAAASGVLTAMGLAIGGIAWWLLGRIRRTRLS